MKQIESLCKPLIKLGKNGVVKVEDIKNGYNKAPLAEVAFDLFKCLLDAKKLLVYQNEHIADVSVVVKDQKQKLVELDTSLVEAIEQSSRQNLMEEMLKGIEENKRAIADVKAELKDSSDAVVAETTKMSSYAEVMKKNSEQQTANLQQSLKKTLMDVGRSQTRKKNIMIFKKTSTPLVFSTKDLPKTDEETIDQYTNYVFEKLDVSTSVITDAVFIGKKKTDDIDNNGLTLCVDNRPLKLTLNSEDAVLSMLRNSHKLKTCYSNEQFYIAPDRTAEERRAHKHLVKELRKKIEEEPKIKWVIRGDKVENLGELDLEDSDEE